ncbi:MAG: c-type cytochrome [Bacteroidota bacterium]
MFKSRAQVPIEQRNYSVAYIVFAGALFLGTMWAVVDEVSTRRPWKEVQEEYAALAKARITERLDQAIADFDSTTYVDLSAQLAAAQDSMQGPLYTAVNEQYTAVLELLATENREYQFAKSRGDEAYYFYKKSLHEGDEDKKEKELLAENEVRMNAHMQVITRLEARRDSLAAVLNRYKQDARNLQSAIGDLRKDIDKWQSKLARVTGSPIEIKQVMMQDYDRNPFNDPKARIDRCQTCHLGWKEDVMEDAPEPFRRHPLPELLAVHKPETVGCTTCHRGQGPALTAGAAHGEADPYWENPLLKGIEVWASCNECHENQSHLDGAPVFSSAKRLMIESGCFGCHEIAGYTDLPKIGPELGRIGHKTTPEWIFRWVRNPKEYNSHTRMPNFRFTDEQAAAVTAFLWSLSSREPFTLQRGAVAGGDPIAGRKVFETAGCQACHVLGNETKVREARGTSYDIAPELTRVGSKLGADWIFDWVKNPRHYNSTTRMPNLRLTDREARDVATYLTRQKDDRSFDPKTLDLSSPQQISRGEAIVREYGCAGCHAIPGFEKESRVSVSLSNFGRKRVEEMDFGDTRVPHTWHDWVAAKLKDSRVFATDRIVQKMPIFSFSDDEIAKLRLFLLSQTKDAPDERYVEAFKRKQQDIETGRRLSYEYNCRQCHQLEREGGYIGAIIDEPAYLPPIITGEGKKVQEGWLHDFLKSPSTVGRPNSIRPWVPTRMPTFSLTDDEITKLIKYFLGLSNQDLEVRDYRAYQPDPALVSVGKSIFTDFQCLKCHPTGAAAPRPGEASTSDLAPNLTKARDRLKPEWIVEWLSDPNKLQEGTRMPTFFPDGQSPLPDVLGGDAKKQMQALRDYLISIGEPQRSVVSVR